MLSPAPSPTPASAQDSSVPLLYERILHHLHETRQRIRVHDLQGKTHHLERALAALYELHARLDFDRGGEIAIRLDALYTYFARELDGIGRSLDVELLERVTGMIADLAEAWERIWGERVRG